jgi:predicted dehydrogenase
MGGGIILDDIHEFDLLFWFNNFSKIKKSVFYFDTLSNLKIDVEDICNASFQFANRVIGQVRCDYLQQFKHRNLKIIGEKGNLTWEANEDIVWHEYYQKGKERKRKVFSSKGFVVCDAYKEEIKYFLNCLKEKRKPFNDIKQAREILKPILNR